MKVITPRTGDVPAFRWSISGVFVMVWISAIVVALRGDPCCGADGEKINGDRERYVSIDNVCAWPNLTKLPDGTIAAIIFGQPSHGQVSGDIECWVTEDGRFWEKRGRPAPHDPQTNRMNVAAGLSRHGEMIVLCSGWSDQQQPNRPKQAPYRDEILEPWVCRSSDGGKTWRQFKSFMKPDEGWSAYIPFGDIYPDEQGTLHVSCYGGEFKEPSLSTKIKTYRSWHFQSDDDGESWRRVSVIGEKSNETTILPIGERRWLAAARIDVTEIFRSDDEGLTWRGPQRVTSRNEINGHLTKLDDGRILLTYGVRVAGRYGVAAKFSTDLGESWSEPITLLDDLKNSDCGYPSSVQRGDGKIVTAFYASGSSNHSRYHMGTVIWTP